jgi:glycosyltransferase involved in cell wall biosynthesis
MKVSGFTFLNEAVKRGYPFRESIRSALPICDEFVVVVGPAEDGTVEALQALADPKIKIYRSMWNPNFRNWYVYGQQANIALFNCTGDWAFYIQGDEILHEADYDTLRGSMQKHLNNPDVEALAFDYVHFYGNHNTQAKSPRWYNQEVRIVRNNLRVIFPNDAQYPILLLNNRRSRYLKAAMCGATMYHYGWVQSEFLTSGGCHPAPNCDQIDGKTLIPFTGTHPQTMQKLLKLEIKDVFKADPTYKLTSRELKHRIAMSLERLTGISIGKKHFTLVS